MLAQSDHHGSEARRGDQRLGCGGHGGGVRRIEGSAGCQFQFAQIGCHDRRATIAGEVAGLGIDDDRHCTGTIRDGADELRGQHPLRVIAENDRIGAFGRQLIEHASAQLPVTRAHIFPIHAQQLLAVPHDA